MSAALMASLINAGLATMEAIRTARSENPGLPISVDLKRRLRAQILLLSDELDQDIRAELERRRAEPADTDRPT